jgi:hypothetical protein
LLLPRPSRPRSRSRVMAGGPEYTSTRRTITRGRTATATPRFPAHSRAIIAAPGNDPFLLNQPRANAGLLPWDWPIVTARTKTADRVFENPGDHCCDGGGQGKLADQHDQADEFVPKHSLRLSSLRSAANRAGCRGQREAPHEAGLSRFTHADRRSRPPGSQGQ